jgi:hypothetical protein
MPEAIPNTALLLRNLWPIGFVAQGPADQTDVLAGSEGRILKTGSIGSLPSARVIDCTDAYVSPGRVTHAYHGGTAICCTSSSTTPRRMRKLAKVIPLRPGLRPRRASFGDGPRAGSFGGSRRQQEQPRQRKRHGGASRPRCD